MQMFVAASYLPMFPWGGRRVVSLPKLVFSEGRG